MRRPPTVIVPTLQPLRLLSAFAALLLGAGCLLEFDTSGKLGCELDGVCAEGFACLAGTCVEAAPACTEGDRRCVAGVAWRCSGGGETGEDCAAQGKVCASGACVPRCEGCGGTCVRDLDACFVAAACPETPCAGDELCAEGVCVPRPTRAVEVSRLACYRASRPTGTAELTGLTVNPLREPVPNAVALSLTQAGTSHVAGADATFRAIFNLGEPVQLLVPASNASPSGAPPQLSGVVQSVQAGPTPLESGDRVEVVVFSRAQADALREAETVPAGPPWDWRGGALLLGRVRDCTGRLLEGATVGYSLTPGRSGYFGNALDRRQRDRRETGPLGAFAAFDLPAEVPVRVVAAALADDGEVVVLGSVVVRAPKPVADHPWSIASVALGRGALP